jgi:hypothetical protein
MQDVQRPLDAPGNGIGALFIRAFPGFGYGAGPFLMLCENSVAAWQKSYEEISQSLTAQQKVNQGKPQVKPNVSAIARYDSAITQAKTLGESIFFRIVPMQWEIFRFLCSQCEKYFEFIADSMHCQSVSQLTQLELAFLNKMLADYNIEGERLFQEFQQSR